MLAATGAGAGRDTPATYRCLPREAWPEAEPLGCMSPSGKNRGGTPEGVRVPKGRALQPAKLRRLRNSVLRRSASFILFFVARMKRSEIRERHTRFSIVPGLRFAASGLRLGPDRDEAGHHNRIYLTKVGF